MKSPDENLDKNLDRLLGQLGNPDPEQMEQRIGSVAQSLRPIALGLQEFTGSDRDPVHQAPQPNRRRRRIAAVFAAIAAMLVVVLSAAVWRAKEVRPLVKSAQERSNRPAETLRLNGEETSVTTTLTDGSHVEMRAGSEASVERVSDGLRIHLNAGSIIVKAAKQAPGHHLYVKTKDVTVSVVGTVFLVKADDNGSHVAVIEGAVHVKQGNVEKNLQPGEQASSDKENKELALAVEIGWSREAAAYLALLHQSLAQKLATRQSSRGNAPVSDKPQFEEASIRPCPEDFRAPEGMRGGGSNSLRMSPGRLDALCLTPATLIRTAYRKLINNSVGPVDPREPFFFNLTYGLGMEDGTRVRGGPDWIRSEKFTIAAVARGRLDAPTLAGPMLLLLLEKRFGLKVHVESEEISVWTLNIAKGGLKIKPAEQGSCVTLPPFSPLDEEAFRRFEAARGTKPICWITTEPVPPNYRDTSVGGTMHQLADILSLLAFDPPDRIGPPGPLASSLGGLRVLDKTGIPDTQRFNFVLEYGADPDHYARGDKPTDQPTAPLGPTVFDALGKLGLTLERGKGSREYIVIDHIERPSEN